MAFSYIEPACAPRYRVELIALTVVKDKVVENVIISTSNNARAGKPILLRFILFMLRHRCRINEVFPKINTHIGGGHSIVRKITFDKVNLI